MEQNIFLCKYLKIISYVYRLQNTLNTFIENLTECQKKVLKIQLHQRAVLHQLSLIIMYYEKLILINTV